MAGWAPSSSSGSLARRRHFRHGRFPSGMAGADATAGRGIGSSEHGNGRRRPDLRRRRLGLCRGRRRREFQFHLRLWLPRGNRFRLQLRGGLPRSVYRRGNLGRSARLVRDGNDRGPEGRVVGLDQNLFLPAELGARGCVLEGRVGSGRAARAARDLRAPLARAAVAPERRAWAEALDRRRASPRPRARAAGAPA